MKSAGRRPEKDYLRVLEATRTALARGERAKARRLARQAISLAPDKEGPWLFLAAVSEPRAGLAYVARALEINPRSRPARKAIRWIMRRLPPGERKQAVREARLPDDLAFKLVPWEALTLRRLFSGRVLISALVLVGIAGVWLGNQPADAQQPQMASAPLAKASLTPTPTNTPTPTLTPTPTATPTLTATPSPTATPTRRPAVSRTYILDPSKLAGEGRWIDVDVTAQRVTAYDGAAVIRSFIVSTGTRAHPTVTGQFKIYVKYRATPMSGPGYYLPGVPFTMYYYKGYAIHGTYWHDNFGTPMSHGCVNLRTPDAEWLFNFASVGMLVNVHP
ncbi:MAG: L,D-transpeptidase [Anaerolineales bacterium]|nr:MAG: L,D-transpeptidase [Anaerolineales bacterium]